VPYFAHGERLSADDVFMGLLTAAALLLVFLIVVPPFMERLPLLMGLGLKIVASAATVLVFQYFYLDRFVNDNIVFHIRGIEIAARIREDGLGAVVEHAKLAFLFGAASVSTERIHSLSGLLHIATFDSFLGASIVSAAAGFAGQALLYFAFVAWAPERSLRHWWQFGLFFFPSLVFWSAGLFKDTFGFFAMGCAVFGTLRLAAAPSVGLAIASLGGFYGVALFRPQILVPLGLSLPIAAVASVLARRAAAGRPVRLNATRRMVLGAACALLAFLVVGGVGVIVPRFSVAALPAQLVAEVAAYEYIEAGSTLEQALVAEPTWGALISAWPLAILTTYFRPTLWEASGVLASLSAIENAVLTVLTLRVGWQLLTSRSTSALALRCAPLWTCVTFLAIFGLGIGVSTPNLGSISRYRIPGLPFLTAALILVESCSRDPADQRNAAASAD
jgi:hypothetical protein